VTEGEGAIESLLHTVTSLIIVVEHLDFWKVRPSKGDSVNFAMICFAKSMNYVLEIIQKELMTDRQE
jgi:hypothetical protein